MLRSLMQIYVKGKMAYGIWVKLLMTNYISLYLMIGVNKQHVNPTVPNVLQNY